MKVAIIGTGYVGLTTGVCLSDLGHHVTCIDNDQEKLKLLDTLFLLHEEFEVDGFTSFEIGHETPLDNDFLEDDFGVVFQRSSYGIPVPKKHPVKDRDALEAYEPPVPDPSHLLLLNLAMSDSKGKRPFFG